MCEVRKRFEHLLLYINPCHEMKNKATHLRKNKNKTSPKTSKIPLEPRHQTDKKTETEHYMTVLDQYIVLVK